MNLNFRSNPFSCMFSGKKWLVMPAGIVIKHTRLRLRYQNCSRSAIVSCEQEKGWFITQIFTISKTDGSSRMILNLKNLNQFIEYGPFKMESFSTFGNTVKPNCRLMASIDLKDAYHLVIKS